MSKRPASPTNSLFRAQAEVAILKSDEPIETGLNHAAFVSFVKVHHE